jgi:hypothetical protein
MIELKPASLLRALINAASVACPSTPTHYTTQPGTWLIVVETFAVTLFVLITIAFPAFVVFTMRPIGMSAFAYFWRRAA